MVDKLAHKVVGITLPRGMMYNRDDSENFVC